MNIEMNDFVEDIVAARRWRHM